MATATTMLLTRLLTITVFITCCWTKQKHIYQVSKALHKTVDYMLKNKDNIGLSSYFGIVRVKALLNGIQQNKIGQRDSLSLPSLHQKLDVIINLKSEVLHDYEEWVLQISNYTLWVQNISYKCLEKECLNPVKVKTIQVFPQLINEATTACITPEMFEFCMKDLYYASKRTISEVYCKTQEACKYFIWDTYGGIGYESTHRLLYIQIFKVWKCATRDFLQMHIQPLCSFIYKQALAIQGRGPFFDLFLEQVFLCGVEGYMEFLNINWLKFILNNQLPLGCFPYFERSYGSNFTVPISANNGCSEHANGLGAAVFALYMNFLSNSRPIEDCD